MTVLGATGSIGLSTLDVLSRHPQRYQVHALTAANRVSELAALCIQHRPKIAVIANTMLEGELIAALKQQAPEIEIRSGEQALCDVASDTETDYVMAAIVGAVGLRPTLAAAKAGKRVLLANKEVLVMAGPLFMDAVRQHAAELLPIDSEHNAIFQCLPRRKMDQSVSAVNSGSEANLAENGIRKVWLTASGGPFRQMPASQWASITPEQATKHPNWDMGPKISVDSATLMNKGLEFIEALHLFSLQPEDVEVVVHPQSIIHSMVEYVDGSFLAQLGSPDMRTPIAHALAWPERHEAGVERLNPLAMSDLQFEPVDAERFPCIRLAREAGEALAFAPLVMNAANEVAVESFLVDGLSFIDIPHVVEETLSHASSQSSPYNMPGIEELVALDKQCRKIAAETVTRFGGKRA